MRIEEKTDIVVTTCERLDLLKRTLAYIWERTVTPYRLHVMDDASTEGNVGYLQDLLAEGRLASTRLRKKRVGIVAQLKLVEKVARSDPVVFTDDDILCPRLEPDWLARGLEAMGRFPRLGLLALNTPGCNVRHSRGEVTPRGVVSFCRNVPGSFVFARREVLATCMPAGNARSPVKVMCRNARKAGWRVGYLTEVYCQHIGVVSVRNGKDLSRDLDLVLPVDGETLEPPERYRG
jgi:hypothetical protein